MAFHIHRAMRTDLLAGGLGALLRNGASADSLVGFGPRYSGFSVVARHN